MHQLIRKDTDFEVGFTNIVSTICWIVHNFHGNEKESVFDSISSFFLLFILIQHYSSLNYVHILNF